MIIVNTLVMDVMNIVRLIFERNIGKKGFGNIRIVQSVIGMPMRMMLNDVGG